jgi:hypothetical protein
MLLPKMLSEEITAYFIFRIEVAMKLLCDVIPMIYDNGLLTPWQNFLSALSERKLLKA